MSVRMSMNRLKMDIPTTHLATTTIYQDNNEQEEEEQQHGVYNVMVKV